MSVYFLFYFILCILLFSLFVLCGRRYISAENCCLLLRVLTEILLDVTCTNSSPEGSDGGMRLADINCFMYKLYDGQFRRNKMVNHVD
jgi:hypothetical protein